jgi:hypothetical protein
MAVEKTPILGIRASFRGLASATSMRYLLASLFLACVCVQVAPLRPEWEISYTQAQPLVPPGKVVDGTANILDDSHQFFCLTGQRNKNNNLDPIDRNSSNYVPGSTYWINEWMAVGHMMYDVIMIQVMESMRIDRIITQRPACYADQCNGIGTFDSYFRGFYLAAINAFAPGIPVYLRWTGKDRDVVPLYIRAENDDVSGPGKPITLQHIMSFERVARRANPEGHFWPGVGPSAVQKFKQSAYKIVEQKHSVSLIHHFDRSQPIVITLAHRGPHGTRSIENIGALKAYLSKAFGKPYPVSNLDISTGHMKEHTGNVLFQYVNTSNYWWPYADQVRYCHRESMVMVMVAMMMMMIAMMMMMMMMMTMMMTMTMIAMMMMM